jgi:hypothetical protein
MKQLGVLGLPQLRELSTSDAYIDHHIRFAISPMMGFETPGMRWDKGGRTWPTGCSCNRFLGALAVEYMETNTVTETNRQTEVVVSH